jgi:hypothetical protein
MTTRHPLITRITDNTGPSTGSDQMTNRHSSRKGTEMHTMHEALAREHMRQLEQEARRHALSSELASANRWRYLERHAHAAYRRHARRAHRAARATAVSRY